ncbi:S8 family peptidase [Hazenella coriacea]|uniref:Serine protease AprX n=1 Tax=Hazenella coriacea TaxID=1179467 RepID=A0A4R3L767_9BACL|nr:S8 family peptidase [Hazenella coriacea]TCS94938.1 serine protease AprX [Hazenella coriacea]
MPTILSRWVIDHGSKMDPALKNMLMHRFRFLHRIPRIFRIATEMTLQRVTSIPVLVQLELDPVQANSMTINSNPLKFQGFSIKKYFKELRTCSLPVSLSQLPQLLQLSEVKKIYLDRTVTTCLDVASPTVSAPHFWKEGNEGQGTTIAIIDTGIHPHPDLSDRLTAFVDFVNHKKKPYDDNGHGTHCAGCAVGDGKLSQGRYRGTAPKAQVVGVKVLGRFGEGSLSKVISGIEWCIKNKDKYNIRIISLSLGTEATLPYQDDPICQIVELAWKAGIIVVAAAGNAGPDPQTISSPGHHPLILTVGASDDRNTTHPTDDQVATFSSRGPTAEGLIKPDLVAPGTNITSLRSKCSFLDYTMHKNRVDGHYFVMSGTSMATPLVAGAIAILLTENPSLTPNQVKEKLIKSARSLDDLETSQGKGQLDIRRAFFIKNSSL